MNASKPTPIHFRALATIFRFAGWITVAWLVFYVVRVTIEIVWQHRGATFLTLLLSIPYNLVSILVAAVGISALVFVPGAYVVWAKPERKFWAESLTWWKGTIPAATVGLVVGVVFGVLARR